MTYVKIKISDSLLIHVEKVTFLQHVQTSGFLINLSTAMLQTCFNDAFTLTYFTANKETVERYLSYNTACTLSFIGSLSSLPLNVSFGLADSPQLGSHRQITWRTRKRSVRSLEVDQC